MIAEKNGKFNEIGQLAGVAFDNEGNARGAMGIDAAYFRNNDDLGIAIGNFANEFADDQFKYTAEARYVADQAIVRLEGFDKAGTLASRADLMRSYIYGAIIYSSIADQYDDFAFSNKTVPAAPVGRANMGRLYDTAVGYLDKALAIATSNSCGCTTGVYSRIEPTVRRTTACCAVAMPRSRPTRKAWRCSRWPASRFGRRTLLRARRMGTMRSPNARPWRRTPTRSRP